MSGASARPRWVDAEKGASTNFKLVEEERAKVLGMAASASKEVSSPPSPLAVPSSPSSSSSSSLRVGDGRGGEGRTSPPPSGDRGSRHDNNDDGDGAPGGRQPAGGGGGGGGAKPEPARRKQIHFIGALDGDVGCSPDSQKQEHQPQPLAFSTKRNSAASLSSFPSLLSHTAPHRADDPSSLLHHARHRRKSSKRSSLFSNSIGSTGAPAGDTSSASATLALLQHNRGARSLFQQIRCALMLNASATVEGEGDAVAAWWAGFEQELDADDADDAMVDGTDIHDEAYHSTPGRGESIGVPPAAAARKSIFQLQREDPAPLSEEEQHLDVRQRALLRRRAKLEAKERAVLRTQQRSAIAESRRNFHENMRYAQLVGMWRTLIYVRQYVSELHMQLRKKRALDFFMLRLLPIISLRVFRLRRKRELQRRLPTMTRPTVAMLQKDKMLSYFGFDHLSAALPMLRPVFFEAGDVIVYQGAEGHEAYLINHGEVDVLVNKTWCASLKPGDIFGTLGMISGEPRIATCKARTALLCWMLLRDEFLGLGQALDERVMAKAMGIVTELHESNITMLYPHLLQGSQLKRFYIFSSVPVSLLDELIPRKLAGPQSIEWSAQLMAPKAFKPGDTIFPAGERVNAPLYVLRGKISVIVEKSALSAVGGKWKSLEELLMMHLDIFELPRTERENRAKYFTQLVQMAQTSTSTSHLQHHPVGPSAHSATAVAPPVRRTTLMSRSGPVQGGRGPPAPRHAGPPGNPPPHGSERLVFGPLPAQMLLCCPLVLINEPCAVTIVAATTVDAMCLPRSKLINHMMQDPGALYTMRRTACRIRALFMRPPQRAVVLAALLGPQLVEKFPDAVSELRAGIRFPSAKPVVLDIGETLSFVPGQRDVLVVLAGEVDDGQGVVAAELPFLWPPLAVTYYGSYTLSSRVTAKIEGYTMKRVEIVNLLHSLSPLDLEALQADLAAAYTKRVGRRPIFEPIGNEYEALEDDDSESVKDGASSCLRPWGGMAKRRPQQPWAGGGSGSSDSSGGGAVRSGWPRPLLPPTVPSRGWPRDHPSLPAAAAAAAHPSLLAAPATAVDREVVSDAAGGGYFHLRNITRMPRFPDQSSSVDELTRQFVASRAARSARVVDEGPPSGTRKEVQGPSPALPLVRHFRSVELDAALRAHGDRVTKMEVGESNGRVRAAVATAADEGCGDDQEDALIAVHSEHPPLHPRPFMPPLQLALLDESEVFLPPLHVEQLDSVRDRSECAPLADSALGNVRSVADSRCPRGAVGRSGCRGPGALSAAATTSAAAATARIPRPPTHTHTQHRALGSSTSRCCTSHASATIAPPLRQPPLTTQHHVALLRSIAAASPFHEPGASHALAPASLPPRMTEASRHLPLISADAVFSHAVLEHRGATCIAPRGAARSCGTTSETSQCVTGRTNIAASSAATVARALEAHQRSMSLSVASPLSLPSCSSFRQQSLARNLKAEQESPVLAAISGEKRVYAPKFSAAKMMGRQREAHMQRLDRTHKLHLTS